MPVVCPKRINHPGKPAEYLRALREQHFLGEYGGSTGMLVGRATNVALITWSEAGKMGAIRKAQLRRYGCTLKKRKTPG